MCPLKVLHCVKVEDLFLYNVSLGSRHHRINCYCACTKGGCLSHGGSSSPRAAPEGSPRAQPWPLPLCAPQGQGRPRAGWTPPWLRCWGAAVARGDELSAQGWQHGQERVTAGFSPLRAEVNKRERSSHWVLLLQTDRVGGSAPPQIYFTKEPAHKGLL